jgi:hypothetical protein
MLMLLHERLAEALARCRHSLEDWRPLESCLHAFFAIAEAVGSEEGKQLPRFFASLQDIPAGAHIRVVATALDAVGKYTHLVNKCPHAGPQYINSYAIICIAPGDCGHLL